MKRPHRIFRIVFMIILSLSALLFIAGVILSNYAKNKLDRILLSQGMTIGSLSVNLFSQSVTIKEFSWSKAHDSIPHYTHHCKVETIYAGGIGVFNFLKSKKLEIKKLSVSNGTLSYNTAFKIQKDSTEAAPAFLKGLSLGELVFKEMSFSILNDTIEEYSGSTNITIKDLRLKNLKDASVPQAYHVGSFTAEMTGLKMNSRESMYRLSVAALHANSNEHSIDVDSIVLIPKFSRYTFSRKVGRQLDRFVLRIPKINVEGFAFDGIKDSLFVAKLVNIRNVNLHVYRDKRLPFIKDQNMPLPIAMLRELPFEIAFDSIKIIDSKITYQEFPEKGYQTGHIVFTKLNASIDHINNRNYYPDYKQATIKAKARVMGTGFIDAEFSLPYTKSQIYNAKGSISNLALPRLNPMLESLAFISVESGKLNQLSFNFDYDDFKSDGSILINYENLKLIGLTKKKESDRNDFKTWVLNMFLKKDKDKSVSKDKRTGTIEYERDRRKALFNVWVKSLMSGVKSSVLDTPAEKEKDGMKNQKKEKKKVDSRKTEKGLEKQKG
ncbi:MAG: DUF748 domain-containing protein [Chryseolinea sp.]